MRVRDINFVVMWLGCGALCTSAIAGPVLGDNLSENPLTTEISSQNNSGLSRVLLIEEWMTPLESDFADIAHHSSSALIQSALRGFATAGSFPIVEHGPPAPSAPAGSALPHASETLGYRFIFWNEPNTRGSADADAHDGGFSTSFTIVPVPPAIWLGLAGFSAVLFAAARRGR
jgi:hypothetical protein